MKYVYLEKTGDIGTSGGDKDECGLQANYFKYK